MINNGSTQREVFFNYIGFPDKPFIDGTGKYSEEQQSKLI